MTIETIERGIGDNLPPSAIEELRAALAERAAKIIGRKDELLASVGRMPGEIADEEMAGKFADQIKLVTACHKAAEGMRVAEKEPHLEAGRAVDGFFKTITNPLETAKKKIEGVLTAYQRKKADEERRRRAEAERLAQEEATRAAQEAARLAEAMKTEKDLGAALEADAQARQAAADAEKAAREAAAKPADLSRTRGDYGGVASLKTFWDFADLDRAKLDLEALRAHLPQDALEKAVRSFVKAGGRELRGVRIFENNSTVVR